MKRDENKNEDDDLSSSLSKFSSSGEMSEKSSAHNKEEKEKKADTSDASSTEGSADSQTSYMNITENEKKKRVENSQTESLSVSDPSSSLISVCELSALSSLSISHCCFLSVSLLSISHCCSTLFTLSSVLISAAHCLTFCILCIKCNVTAVSDSFNSFISNKTDKMNELKS